MNSSRKEFGFRGILAAGVMTGACLCASAANYFWNPEVTEGAWSNPASWCSNRTGTPATSYPQTTSDVAYFDAVTKGVATVTLSEPITIKSMNLNTTDLDLTFKGGPNGTNDLLTVAGIEASAAGGEIVLDNVAMACTAAKLTFGKGRGLHLKNGADLRMGAPTFNEGAVGAFVVEGSSVCSFSGGVTFPPGMPMTIDGGSSATFSGVVATKAGAGVLTVSGGSILRAAGISLQKGSSLTVSEESEVYDSSYFDMVLGNVVSISGRSLVTVVGQFRTGYNGNASLLTIDDSTLVCKGDTLLSTGTGGDIVLFKGANPVFRVTGGNFYSTTANGGLMNFEVPVGGYREAPIQSLGTAYLQNNNTGKMYINILASSPALTAGGKVVTPMAYVAGSSRMNRIFFDHASNAAGASAFRFTEGASGAVATADANAHGIVAEFGTGSAQPAPAVSASTGPSLFIGTAVSRRTVTVSTLVSALANDGKRTRVRFYVGESADGSGMTLFETREVAGVGLVASSGWTAPEGKFETDYFFKAVAETYVPGESEGDEGEVTNREESTIACARTLDVTVYTWKGGETGNWSDASNWANDRSDDCLGHPASVSSSVQFPAGVDIAIVMDEESATGTLSIPASGTTVTFVNGGSSTNENKFTCTSIGMDSTGPGAFVFDGLAVSCANACTIGNGKRMVLRNGSNVHFAGNLSSTKCGWLELYDQSWLSVDNFYIGTDGTRTDGGAIVDDSTVCVRNGAYLGSDKPGGILRFQGAQPRMLLTSAAAHFRSNLANAGVRMEFLVPVGGYSEAVISGAASPSYYMGNNGNNAGASTISVNVSDESPANRVDATITTPLIAWAKGINKTRIVEGDLPDGGKGTDDAFVWADGDYPVALGATITGSAHTDELTITGAPETVPASSMNPAYGSTVGLTVGQEVVCSVPSDVIPVSDGKRATCTGWKLYSVDPITRVRTLVDSNSGATYTYRHDGTWHELEWQWKIEYRVSVTSSGNGTARADEEWLETGKKAHVVPVPAAGYGFGKWTGDVPEGRDKSMELRFIVRGRAYSFEASFLPVVYVKPESEGGSDSNGGTSWSDALATIAEALKRDANGYILLADGTYEVDAPIVLEGGATVAGANLGAKAVVKCMKPVSASSDKENSIFTLAHADARLYNIAITTDYDKDDSTRNAFGVKRNSGFSRGVWLEGGGLVDSCLITNCLSSTYNSAGGGGVYLNGGGIVRNSTLAHNSAEYQAGHNAYVNTAGLIESCVLAWGASGSVRKGNNTAGGAYLAGAGAIIRNSLVMHCTEKQGSGATGVKMAPGVMENCTIVEGFQVASTQAAGTYVDRTGNVIRNCIIWNNSNAGGLANWSFNLGYGTLDKCCTATCNCTTPEMPGTGNITTDPSFVAASDDNFRIGLSGAVDSAVYLEWMDWVGDLDGNDRVQGEAPDMGCYEFTPAALSCGFEVETEGVLGLDTITLTAQVTGSDLEELSYTWTLTDQDGGKTVRSGSDLATLVIPMPVGAYDVTLAIANGAGDQASVTRPKIFAVCPSNVYVDPVGSDKYPYSSYETGATTIEAALAAAADGTVIHLNDGWYELADALAISKAVTIVSEHGYDRTFVYGRSTESGVALITLANSEAVLGGVTVTGVAQDGETRPAQSGGVRVTGGTVTNCCICNHLNGNGSIIGGVGCRLEGGTVVDCLFTNNYASYGGRYGGAIYQTGADSLVDRCVVVSNWVAAGTLGTAYGGGIYLTAGTVRNSLVIGNRSAGPGGGLAVYGSGEVQNCTVISNTSDRVDSVAGVAVSSVSAKVVNTVVFGNQSAGVASEVGGIQDFADCIDHCVIGIDPKLRYRGKLPYRPKSSSPCVDAGKRLDWMDGALDVYGQPRIYGIGRGGMPDVGAVESTPSGLSVLLK